MNSNVNSSGFTMAIHLVIVLYLLVKYRFEDAKDKEFLFHALLITHVMEALSNRNEETVFRSVLVLAKYKAVITEESNLNKQCIENYTSNLLCS